MTKTQDPIYRVTGKALEEPWEGSLEELLAANLDMPELVRRRLATLKAGERRILKFKGGIFMVEQLGPDSQVGPLDASSSIFDFMLSTIDCLATSDEGYEEECEMRARWAELLGGDRGAGRLEALRRLFPTPNTLEPWATMIEGLLEELRRRGITYEGDLSEYEDYRLQNPKIDA